MSQSMQNLAASLEALEEEVGLEDLSQLLADMLLVSSARIGSGNKTNPYPQRDLKKHSWNESRKYLGWNDGYIEAAAEANKY